MRSRKVKVEISIGGMTMPLGEFKIQNFAYMYDYKDSIERLCPKDDSPVTWKGGYECDKCGTTYPHWSHLKAVETATGKDVSKKRLTKKGETAVAKLFRLPIPEFSEKYADATLSEAGILVNDPNSAMNLQKLIVAIERLNEVIVLKFPDTEEWRICVLTLSASNRVILREIIPANLLRAKETLFLDMETITEADVEQAQLLVNQIPMVTDEVMMVSDYRTTGLGEVPKEAPQAPKVQALAEILAQVQTD